MEENSKISVIVPCYNQAKFLEDALNSVLLQTHSDWECIIVNDGSTDDTQIIARRWLKKDTRFIYLEKLNGGLSSARNAGLEVAKGDYVQFLDADDYLHPDKFQASIDNVADCKVAIVVSNFSLFVTLEKLYSPYCVLNQELLTLEAVLYNWDAGFSIPIHCGFFKKELFDDFRFPEQLKAKEDWVMWVSLLKMQPKILFIDSNLAYYRKHPESMTIKNTMLPETLKAVSFLKTILNEEEYEKLYARLISRYYLAQMELKRRLHQIKNSNSYQTVLMIKKLLKKLGLLKFSKKIFPFFLWFKAKN